MRDTVHIILDKTKDITAFCGDLTITDDLESIAKECSFSVATNPKDKYLTESRPKVQVGSRIDVMGETGELFSGIVIETGIAGSVTANDYGFYLAKNEVILQVQTDAATAIQELCNKAGIPMGQMPSMGTRIEKLYSGQTCAEILSDLLEQVTIATGKNYFFRVEEGKLNIYTYPTAITYAKHKFETGNVLDVTYALGSVDGTDSMTEMKNTVQVVSSDNDQVKVLATAEDAGSIATFGRLQKIVEQSGEGENPDTLAKNTLLEYNSVTKERTVGNLLGSEEVKAGVLLLFSSAAYEVDGVYLVTAVTHNFTGTGHTMSLTIQRPEVG